MNHLYWSAVSTPDGDGDLIQAKWMSLDNHVHNRHKKHGTFFPACKHKAKGRKKKWFKPRKYYIAIVTALSMTVPSLYRHQGQ